MGDSAAHSHSRPRENLLRALISQGIEALRANGTLPADSLPPDFVVERPKTRDHGDFATNAAMLLAKAARSNPRALAQALVEARAAQRRQQGRDRRPRLHQLPPGPGRVPA